MPAPLHGNITVSTSAQPLSAATVNCATFTIKAAGSNVFAVFIGASNVTTANGYQMDPGDEFAYERVSFNGQPIYELRPSDFYVIAGQAGDHLSWLASPL